MPRSMPKQVPEGLRAPRARRPLRRPVPRRRTGSSRPAAPSRSGWPRDPPAASREPARSQCTRGDLPQKWRLTKARPGPSQLIWPVSRTARSVEGALRACLASPDVTSMSPRDPRSARSAETPVPCSRTSRAGRRGHRACRPGPPAPPRGEQLRETRLLPLMGNVVAGPASASAREPGSFPAADQYAKLSPAPIVVPARPRRRARSRPACVRGAMRGEVDVVEVAREAISDPRRDPPAPSGPDRRVTDPRPHLRGTRVPTEPVARACSPAPSRSAAINASYSSSGAARLDRSFEPAVRLRSDHADLRVVGQQSGKDSDAGSSSGAAERIPS